MFFHYTDVRFSRWSFFVNCYAKYFYTFFIFSTLYIVTDFYLIVWWNIIITYWVIFSHLNLLGRQNRMKNRPPIIIGTDLTRHKMTLRSDWHFFPERGVLVKKKSRTQWSLDDKNRRQQQKITIDSHIVHLFLHKILFYTNRVYT